MGITYCDVLAYRSARLRGASFARTLLLGRQQLYLHRPEHKALCDLYIAERGVLPASLRNYEWGCYAEDFLREILDITTLTSLDNSAYEGAERIHDMNRAIPDEWRSQFDVVIDCGSLEHIFNVPVALRNLADMITVGGSIFITTPSNNLTGHGFYQFSPELMFRVFSAENGFAMRDLTLREASFPTVELTRTRKIYSVTDPQDVHRRVGLMSKRPVIMLVEAEKIEDVEMFTEPPYQSDYVAMWTPVDDDSEHKSRLRKGIRRIVDLLPATISALILGEYEKRRFSFRNRDFYNPVPVMGASLYSESASRRCSSQLPKM